MITGKLNGINLKITLQVLLLLALPILPCFHDLGNLPFRIWDEARQAHNALEMYRSQHYMVPTYDGIPDTFGTKPALFIWMQVASIHLFGLNEFAIRFPSALSAYILAIILMGIVWYYFKSYRVALIAGILLLTSYSIIRIHVARTADYDAPLAMFSDIACICFFIFISGEKKLYWYLTCTFFALAVLMKGSAGLLFVPALIIYALLQGKLIPMLKSFHTYAGILLFLIPVTGYYILRDIYQPGYLQLVLDSEWKSIYFKTSQGHEESASFYIVNIYQKWFSAYWWMFPLGVISAVYCRDGAVKSIARFSLVCVTGYLLVISNSATKLFWYDAPVYFFIVIICTCFVYYLFELLKLAAIPLSRQNTFQVLFVFVFALFGWSKIAPVILDPAEDPAEGQFYSMAKFLQIANRDHSSLDGYKILSGNAYSPHHTFYIKLLNEKGQRVQHAVFEDIQVQDSVMVFENNIRELLLNKYKTTFIASNNNIFAYRVDAIK